MPPVLQVRDLRVHFFLDEGLVRAVDGVSFDVDAGQVVGIVGESGCGKSVTMKALLQIVEPPGRIVGGQMLFRTDRRAGRGSGPALAARRGHARDPRRRDRAHPAGADGGLQSRAHRGRSDHRGAPAPPAQVAAHRPGTLARRRAHDHRRAVPGRRRVDAGRARGRLRLAALRRAPPARDDRHGAVVPPASADRRRAHHRAGRDDAGADPEPAARPAAPARHGDRLHHPRPRCHRPDRALGGRDVPGPRDGARPGRRHLPRAQAPLHARRCSARSRACWPRRSRRCPPSPARSPTRSAGPPAAPSIRAVPT